MKEKEEKDNTNNKLKKGQCEGTSNCRKNTKEPQDIKANSLNKPNHKHTLLYHNDKMTFHQKAGEGEKERETLRER